MKDDLNLAIAVVVESTFQIALFVTPFLVILGWIMARPMALCFDIFVITVFFLDVVVVNCLTRDRRTNCLEGALLIGAYFLITIAFSFHPDIVNTPKL
ncbi:hypothetical protein F5882DRAFT_79331 [Hyaloscypha sp. PMI_1271]|nr:hypothetical protein F5882DRAFT_79331 [Hyaloscypha sp. PMI_1271]